MENILENLNPPQKEAVLTTEGPLLILAGAGSGKTRVLTRRIAYMISQRGLNPWNILAITFTNKAAAEMRDRINAIVGFGAEQIWVSTFHSCCVRILRRHIENLGYTSSFVIYDAEDQKSLMKDILRRREADPKIFREKGVLAAISRAKDDMLRPEDLEKDAGNDFYDSHIASFYRDYQEALKKNNALDFDDLLVKTVELFEGFPEILRYYQDRFRYISIDEYQDTNNVQFRFVNLLASRYRNLCVVGDDDQSIYKFRGANIRNILEFEDAFPETKVIRLEQNYRSTQRILEAANRVIRHNSQRKEKTLWTENEKGNKIRFQQFFNGFEEAEQVVGEIASLHRHDHVPYQDFAILYRTNAQSRLFEEKLLFSNIPYRIIGAINFYARKEIKDLLCYLRLIDNSRDDLSVARIVNVPRRGIGSTTLQRLQEYAALQGMALFEAMENWKEIPGLGRGGSKLSPFVSMIQALRTKAEILSVRQILEDVIESTGYVAALEAEGTEEAQSRIENINELISTAQSFQDHAKEEDRDDSLSAFLQELSLITDADAEEEASDRVLLMTLHSAKGLEFPRVYMVGMDDGIFPGFATVEYGDEDDLEEERRLCYVGITRAQKELTLTGARTRMIRGEYRDFAVSRFVREIPRDLIALPYETQKKKPSSQTRMPQPDPAVKLLFKPAKPIYTPAETNLAKSSALDYDKGDTVRHVKFGLGTVTDIKDGGRDYEITVDFERFGTKKMFAGFAKLKRVD